MRPHFVENARPRDESIQLVPRASKFREMRAVKSPCPGVLTAIYCPQQIRAMSACFGLPQGDLESDTPILLLYLLVGVACLKSCSHIVSFFSPSHLFSLHYSHPPSHQIRGHIAGPPALSPLRYMPTFSSLESSIFLGVLSSC